MKMTGTCRLVQMIRAALVFFDVVADDTAVEAARMQQLRIHNVYKKPGDRLAVLLKLRDEQPALLRPQPHSTVIPS